MVIHDLMDYHGCRYPGTHNPLRTPLPLLDRWRSRDILHFQGIETLRCGAQQGFRLGDAAPCGPGRAGKLPWLRRLHGDHMVIHRSSWDHMGYSLGWFEKMWNGAMASGEIDLQIVASAHRTVSLQEGMKQNGDISTLWLFNIAMENGPFIDGLPIKNGDFPWLC